jgi:hypothetical protein
MTALTYHSTVIDIYFMYMYMSCSRSEPTALEEKSSTSTTSVRDEITLPPSMLYIIFGQVERSMNRLMPGPRKICYDEGGWVMGRGWVHRR